MATDVLIALYSCFQHNCNLNKFLVANAIFAEQITTKKILAETIGTKNNFRIQVKENLLKSYI